MPISEEYRRRAEQMDRLLADGPRLIRLRWGLSASADVNHNHDHRVALASFAPSESARSFAQAI